MFVPICGPPLIMVLLYCWRPGSGNAPGASKCHSLVNGLTILVACSSMSAIALQVVVIPCASSKDVYKTCLSRMKIRFYVAQPDTTAVLRRSLQLPQMLTWYVRLCTLSAMEIRLTMHMYVAQDTTPLGSMLKPPFFLMVGGCRYRPIWVRKRVGQAFWPSVVHLGMHQRSPCMLRDKSYGCRCRVCGMFCPVELPLVPGRGRIIKRQLMRLTATHVHARSKLWSFPVRLCWAMEICTK